MAGAGQFVTPVQVQVVGTLGATVTDDGTIPAIAPPAGMAILGLHAATGALFIPRVTATGEWLVTVVGPPPPPGTTIVSFAPVAVPAGVVALPAPPPGTLAINVQNNGAGGTVVAIREVGGPALSGMRLPRFGIFSFNKAVAALEAEFISGPAGAVSVTFEVA